jgi:uncharacterized membrane protein YfcA
MSSSGLRFTFAHVAFAALVLWVLRESMDLPDRAAAIAATVAVSAFVASIVGFAFAALAGSAFAYLRVEPVHAVHTIVVCSIAIQLYAVWNIRGAIRWRPLLPMMLVGSLTVPLGVWVLRHVDSALYAIGLGLFLSVYGGYTVLRRTGRARPANRWVDVLVGALGGVTGGLAGLPGPSVTIWCSLRGLDKLQQRAIYQPFILAMQFVALYCLHRQDVASMLSVEDLRFVPFALTGGVGGFALFQSMTGRQFHAMTSLLLVASGIGLLTRAL